MKFNLVKRLLCKHSKLMFVQNIYGDPINLLDARSIYSCLSCGSKVYKDNLYDRK